MKNSEKILKIAADMRKARIDAIVAPLRKKAQVSPYSFPSMVPGARPEIDPKFLTAKAPATLVKAAAKPAVAPSKTPTIDAVANEAKAWGKDKLGQFKTWGSRNPIGGGAAGGAVLGGMAGLIYEALRGRREGERKDYLRAMLTHALLGAGGGALLGHYKPTVVTDGIKSLPS